jgi:lysophospholipase L1-like esterase
VQINGTNRVGSPFLFSGTFNFTSYLTNRSITMSSNDWVIINHGINDVWDYYQDATLQGQINVVSAYLAQWIASMKSAVPGIRIAICLTIAPSISQDAFGMNYYNDQTRARYVRNLKFWRERLLADYDALTTSNVFVVPYHANLDTINNYPLITRVFNARNAGTYMRQWNAVHPADSGYWQLADLLRSYLKSQE